METHQTLSQLDGNLSLVGHFEESESEEDNDATGNVDTNENTVHEIVHTSDVTNVQKIIVKVKIAANSYDDACNSVKSNLLYILDAVIIPLHLSDESIFDMEVSEDNEFPHTFVLKVELPEDIVHVEENETLEEWNNNKNGIRTLVKEFLIL